MIDSSDPEQKLGLMLLNSLTDLDLLENTPFALLPAKMLHVFELY
jgi:hypothetical protein